MTESTNKIQARLTINSTTDNLEKIRAFIKTYANQSGFNEEDSNKIVLAADEACTNIIKHSYKFNSEGLIKIHISFTKNKFTVSITDYGLHFDSKKIPEPNLKEYYKEKRVGGLGMFLMKKLMDEINYSNPNNKINKVTFVKYLN